MTLQILALACLIGAIVLGFVRKMNVGLVCMGLSLILGTIGGVTTKEIYAGFPGKLFATLLGTMLFFSLLQDNGTLEKVSQKMTSLCGKNTFLVPIIIYVVSFILSAAGPGAISVQTVMVLFAVPLAIHMNLNPILMGAMAILFVPIVVGHGVWMTHGLGAKAAFSWSNFDAILPQIPSEILWQFLGVALPEEYFYRGFVQTNIAYRLEQSPRRSLQKYAAPISIALASMIFASLHVVNGGFVRLVTFFPGCLFGFLRYKTNGIAGAVFAHAMCNLMMFALNIQYL